MEHVTPHSQPKSVAFDNFIAKIQRTYYRLPIQEEVRLWLYSEIENMVKKSDTASLSHYFLHILHTKPVIHCGLRAHGRINTCPECKTFFDSLPIGWEKSELACCLMVRDMEETSFDPQTTKLISVKS